MAPFIVDDDISKVGMGRAYGEGSSFWAPSLDPRNEEKMPMELKTWRRWSNQFDKEKEFDHLRFDMTTLCFNCSSSTWELIDHPELKAVQCRTCGNIPSETRSPRASTYLPRCSTRSSRNLPKTYTEDEESAESSTASSSRARSDSEGSSATWNSTAESSSSTSNLNGEGSSSWPLANDKMASSSSHNGASSSKATMSDHNQISERDFGSPKSPHFSIYSNSGIRSVRQSMIQPAPRPRWFEQRQNMTFQFKLTPRGRTGGNHGATTSAVPMANEDGSTTEPEKSDSGATESSSKPPGSGAAPSTRNIPIHELSEDPTAWQRLLTTALFLMKEDQVPKAGQSKVVDLGLATARNSGGKHLAMKHHTSGEHEAIMQSEKEEAKRVLWKVVVKPAGGVAKSKGGDGSLLPR